MAVSSGRWLVRKLWVQMVTLVVVVVAGLAINSFHGIFGSQDITKSSGNRFVIAQFNPKNSGAVEPQPPRRDDLFRKVL